MECGPPLPGQVRCTLRLMDQQAVKCKLVGGGEDQRVIL